MEELLNIFGQTIKNARQTAGLTQDGLAEQAGITTRCIMAIENENKQPSMKVLFISAFAEIAVHIKRNWGQLKIKNLILYDKKVSSFHIYEHTPFQRQRRHKKRPSLLLRKK